MRRPRRRRGRTVGNTQSLVCASLLGAGHVLLLLRCVKKGAAQRGEGSSLSASGCCSSIRSQHVSYRQLGALRTVHHNRKNRAAPLLLTLQSCTRARSSIDPRALRSFRRGRRGH